MAWTPFKRRRRIVTAPVVGPDYRRRHRAQIAAAGGGGNVYPPNPNLHFINPSNINMPTEPFVDASGRINRSWWRFLQQLRKDVNGLL